MTSLAPILQAFLTDHLMTQRRVSPHTVAAYRDTFKLLLRFANSRSGKQPTRLDLADLNAPLIADFLHHLETDRGNSVSTRNARLAAVHSLFRFAALRTPEQAALIQRVLSIPSKRGDSSIVCFLTPPEVAAILQAPDRSTWAGRRDHALLLLAVQTGLRVSELTALRLGDIHLGTGAHARCQGKGRKDRCTPLTSQTAAVLRVWMTERGGHDNNPLFCTRRGGPLSRDAVERLVTKYATTAARSCSTLQAKKISPHTLRHTAAMQLLHAGVDTSVIALWLGHESTATTQVYLHADMALKEQALARTTPPHTNPGRFTAPDALLAFLDGL
jgi:integrase/recombinase XerD